MSVGNLPPGCTAVIKITYVSELIVDGDHISFRVPGSVAPWTQKTALDTETQSTVGTVKVEGGGEVSVHVAVEMPFDIRSITSPTHRLRIKVSTSLLASLYNGCCVRQDLEVIVIIIIIIITRTMFMVLSSCLEHCESSPGSRDECSNSARWPPTFGPSRPT